MNVSEIMKKIKEKKAKRLHEKEMKLFRLNVMSGPFSKEESDKLIEFAHELGVGTVMQSMEEAYNKEMRYNMNDNEIYMRIFDKMKEMFCEDEKFMKQIKDIDTPEKIRDFISKAGKNMEKSGAFEASKKFYDSQEKQLEN